MISPNLYYGERGAVYITALAMMMLFLAAGIAFLQVSKEESWINRNAINVLKAHYAAESGIQHAIAEFRGGPDDGDASMGDISSSVDMNKDASTDDYSASFNNATNTIISTATVMNATRTIEVEIEVSGSAVNVVFWKGHQ